MGGEGTIDESSSPKLPLSEKQKALNQLEREGVNFPKGPIDYLTPFMTFTSEGKPEAVSATFMAFMEDNLSGYTEYYVRSFLDFVLAQFRNPDTQDPLLRLNSDDYEILYNDWFEETNPSK